MIVGLDFSGVAWVSIDEEELKDNNISIDDEETIADYAYQKAIDDSDSYNIGGEPSCDLITIER